MSKLTKALTAAAGNAGGANLYVEDVFSTYLYTGNSSTQTITNGIDLDGKGGMVWLKSRNNSVSHALFDTERGASNFLVSNATNANDSPGDLNGFNSDGFDLTLVNGHGNFNNYTYASWTFRKAEKFFDVVTYTGNGTAGQAIAHNLGSTPGFIVVKSTSVADYWRCYHSSIGATGAVILDLTIGTSTNVNHWNNTAPTSTEFTAGLNVNATGSTYVAYLFASDAGGFGDDGDENIIKCGSISTNGIGQFSSINLGFEPQWILIKRSDNTGDWYMHDVMRGIGAPQVSPKSLVANTAAAESSVATVAIGASGIISYGDYQLDSNATYIYIAIRRPMKTPESGTEVFAATTQQSTYPNWVTGFPVDWMFYKNIDNANGDWFTGARLIGTDRGSLNTTDAFSASSLMQWDYMNGQGEWSTSADPTAYTWNFKRATGFFDVVAYTGNGTAGTTQAHNLSVAPEMMWIKRRDSSGNWVALIDDGNGDLYKYQYLQTNEAFATSSSFVTANDSSSFTLGSNGTVNATNGNFIAYLFATLAGVSKVGSYTGTGADLNVDCGFSAGARFILIKRTDATGGWHVWDSLRGISAGGNDPYLLLNTTAAEVTNTDYVDPLSSGFTVTSSAPAALNASGGTYIFLAIA